ncbi:hypothetical protein [Paenarthrobacter sp. C1]|uniref:hypothetical protein n=1 Tax=Paenarthrobacter sp. C1 TaxID=3400220 RepID=UPI003BF45FC3
MSDQDLTKAINEAVRPPKPRPRYALGTFWLIIGVAVLIAAFASRFPGHQNGFWAGPLMIGYAIYLYRGGRYGFFIF